MGMKSYHHLRWMRIALLPIIGFVIWYTIWRSGATTHYLTESDAGLPTPIKVPVVRRESHKTISRLRMPEPSLKPPSNITEGYLVYDCSHRWPGYCGGWSDRISGILCTYVLAILTNRKFLINIDNPCPLENYFESKLYDWRYNNDLLGHKPSSNYQLIDDNGRKIMNILLTAKSTKPIKDFFTAEVSFVRINWDMTPEFRKFYHVEDYVPWITRLHFADINRYILDLFFQPKPFLLNIIDNVSKSKRTNSTFCAHVRIGRSSTIPNDNVRKKPEHIHIMLDFIETIDKSKHDLFLATDSDKIQHEFETKYSGNSILTIPGRITHIDRTKTGDVCDGFQKQLLDFLFLRTCDKLVICESGFSMMAAYWRAIPEGLYCWTPYTVVPCSRYTVHDFFPEPLLGPPR